MRNEAMQIKKQTSDYRDSIILIALFMVGFVVRYYLASFDKIIGMYPDEMRYYGIARSIYEGKGIMIRNVGTDFQKILYPLLISPAFAIRDGLVRNKVIDILNCLYMTSSVFPAWLICREAGLSRKNKLFISIALLIWPDMIYTMTFMSEVIYWPTILWQIWLWMLNHKKNSWILAFIEGVLCYIGYLGREIYLAFFLSYIIFEISYPIIGYMVQETPGRKKIQDCYCLHRIIKIGVFAGSFILCHVIAKLTIFKGLGNSYNQQGIEAILSGYNFWYLIYSFLYNLSAEYIICLVIPITLPLVAYMDMDEINKKLYLLLMIFLVLGAGTIAYTITVRESLGKEVPRILTRYVSPVMFLSLIPFIRELEKTQLQGIGFSKKRFATVTIILTILAALIFKGSDFAYLDYFPAFWYSKIHNLIGILNSPEGYMPIRLYAIIAGFVIVMVSGLIVVLINSKRAKVGGSIFAIVYILTCLVSNIEVTHTVKGIYEASPDSIAEVQEMDQFFENEGDSETKLYIASERGLTGKSRLMDTYLDDDNGYYIINSTDVDIEGDIAIRVSDLNLLEALEKNEYDKVDAIDYIIVENDVASDFDALTNVQMLSEFENGKFSVYKNMDPKILEFKLPDSVEILFSGEYYNANAYVTAGISGKEDGFSWTDGENMHVEIQKLREADSYHVTIQVIGTFNGSQRYEIKSAMENTISQGSMDGAGEIEFDIEAIGGNVIFDMLCPDSQVISEVYLDNPDNRRVAFQIAKITVVADDKESI